MICEWCEIGAGEISDYADSAGVGTLVFHCVCDRLFSSQIICFYRQNNCAADCLSCYILLSFP